jgi:hypothetical protein
MPEEGVAPRPIAQWVRRYQHAAAGAIYGTLVTSAVIAGESIANVKLADIEWSVVVTVPIYWLAHVYAVVLAERSPTSARPSWSDLGEALRDESVILESALPPLAPLIVLKVVLH